MEIMMLDDRWEIMFPQAKQQKSTRNMTDEATKKISGLGFCSKGCLKWFEPLNLCDFRQT